MKLIQSLRTPTPWVVLAAALLIVYQANSITLFFQHGWAAVRFPYPLDYGEGPILDQAVQLARFQNIYPNELSTPPYTITNYPPLFQLVQAPFIWLFGPALWYGRAISMISILAAAAFIGLTLFNLTRSRLAGVVGGLTLLTMPYVIHWSPLNRVDSLALGLSCAALFVVTRWPHRRGLIATAILLLAAVYTRQSYALAAPLAAFVWLLREPPRWRAFELAGLVAALGLGLFIVLILFSWGGFFLHIVTANVNPFYWETVEHYVREIGGYMALLLVGSVAFVAAALMSEYRLQPWWLVAPYVVGATLSALTIGKTGSNVNYLLELSAAFSLVVGALVALPGRGRWLAIPVLLLMVLQTTAMDDLFHERYHDRIMGKIERGRDIARLAEAVEAADGPVLLDEYMGMAPLAGQPLYYQPFEFKQLIEAGLWDQQSLVEQIEDKEFPLILLFDPPYWDSQGERWTPELLAAIQDNYARWERVAETLVYRPFILP